MRPTHIITITIATLGLAPTLTADVIGWDGGDDGVYSGIFGEPTNWIGDIVPGAADTAVFDVPASFTVFSMVATTNDRLLVRSGDLTLDLTSSGGHTLESSSPFDIALVVGDEPGDLAGLTVRGGATTAIDVALGRLPGTIGMLRIDGSVSAVSAIGPLQVGPRGVGMLDVTGGASASGDRVTLGDLGGAWGEAVVSGPSSSLSSATDLIIAGAGLGDLLVENAGLVMADDVVIARSIGAWGTVTVRGPGSALVADGTLDVGLLGAGELVIEDGGSVSNSIFATVGTFPGDSGEADAGGVGVVTVRGPGSSWSIDGDLYVAFFSRGTLVLSENGTADVTGDLVLNNYISAGSEPLRVRLGTSGDYGAGPAIDVDGVVTSDSGDPEAAIELVDGFSPQAGDAFRLLRATAGVDTVAVDTPALPDPLDWVVRPIGDELIAEVAICSALDCNGNGLGDDCDVAFGLVPDCNANGVPDSCDIDSGFSLDTNGNGVPDECDCAADVTGDGMIGFADLVQLLSAWGACGVCAADVNGDGVVDFADLVLVLSSWGTSCP